MRLCVFCGSSPGGRADYTAAAKALVEALAANGIGLVYGGASVGLMGFMADTMMAAGGEVIGVIPQSLKDREIAHTGITALHVVDSMHARKAKMAELSDAFIAIPGGIGTLEELFEVWTWTKLGLHNKPCGLLNVAGYYDALLTFLDHMAAESFVKAQHRAMLQVSTCPTELLAQLSDASAKMAKLRRPANAAVVDVLAWICIQDRRLLCARSQGNEVFYLPGGKREQGESDWDGLRREVTEELSVSLEQASFDHLMTVEEIAHGYDEPTWVTMKCFQSGYAGGLVPSGEIEEIAWLSNADKVCCAPATQRVFEYLCDRNLID